MSLRACLLAICMLWTLFHTSQLIGLDFEILPVPNVMLLVGLIAKVQEYMLNNEL